MTMPDGAPPDLDTASEIVVANPNPSPTAGPVAALLGLEASDLAAALLEQSPFAQYVVNSDGTIVFWNAAAETLLGYRPSEIVGQSAAILMPSQFLSLWRDAKQRIRREKVVNIDSVRRHKDGHLVDVGVTAICIRAVGDDLPSYLTVLQDKRRQRQVERENEQMAAFVRHSPIAIVGVDPDGYICSWNAAATNIFGYGAAEVLGRSIALIIPDDARDGSELSISTGAAGHGYEFQSVRSTATGGRVHVSISSAPIINESKAIIGWAHFYKDMTQLVETQATLRASEAFSRSLLEASPDWIAVLDDKGAIVYQNRSPAPDEVPGGSAPPSWLAAWPACQVPSVERALVETMDTGKAALSAMRRVPCGAKRWYDIQLTRLSGTAEGRSLLVNARDITEKKSSDDHIALVNRELSHRAKNLLTVIMAMARNTAEQADDIDDFTRAFNARLFGLSRSHDLLVSQNWVGADFKGLLELQTRPFVERFARAITFEGENFMLRPSAAQCLGMALHELATNSVKYGSLSVPTGLVRVTCAATPSGHAIEWAEVNGPPVLVPSRRGFGASVIEEMVADSFGCEARLEYRPSGIVWTATVPYALAQARTA